jgi:hypothetical protein
MSELVIETAVEQVLFGLQVGHQQLHDFCCGCGRELHGGTPVTAYAYKPSDAPQWDVVRVYCQPCDHTEIETPTLATPDVLVSGCLALTQLAARQTTRHILSDIELQAQSAPTNSTSP